MRVLIAVPTIKLKQEVRERAEAMGIDIIESPSPREMRDDLPSHVWDRIERLYSSGKSITPYLKKVIGEDDPECAALFKGYLRELEEFHNFDGHAITTHKRLLTMDTSKYDLVIIDEDIIFSTVIPNKIDVSVSDLRKLRGKTTPNRELYKKISGILKNAKDSGLFALPGIPYDNAYDDISMGVDIPSLCAATHFCYRKTSDSDGDRREDCVSFVKPVELKGNTKYIMLSATVDEAVCNYYFGQDNVRFYECKKAQYKGSLNQYYSEPMSRAYVAKDTAIIKKIKRWSGYKHTISFKKYKMDDLYFGNAAGCDHMKGKNIDVIGTPHQPEWIYKLFVFSIGLDFDLEEKLKPHTTVAHNGYRFRFSTYDDEKLRAIQFYMIESELEQAVGRARLLRCECTVNLFSNFPLCQAVMKESEYEKDDTKLESA